MAKKSAWAAFPYPEKAYQYTVASVKKSWERLHRGDCAKAIADYTAAIQMNPNIEDAHRRRGECYELLGETEKAQQDFAIEPKMFILTTMMQHSLQSCSRERTKNLLKEIQAQNLSTEQASIVAQATAWSQSKAN